MLYEYKCSKCSKIIELEKSIKDDHPTECPHCKKQGLERHFSSESNPVVLYPGRPIWTYKEVKKFKQMSKDGGPAYKVDPSKHGDLGAWHSGAELAPPKKKKK